MLRTLGFRIPAEHVDRLLGQVAVYSWDTSFANAWERLPRRSRKSGRPTRPPYRQLLTGLTAVHNRPVRIVDEWGLSQEDKDSDIKGMIIAAEQINPFHLTTCVRTFERALRDGEDPNTLAPLLSTADTTRRFRDYVTLAESGTASAPSWLFDCAVWGIMTRLARPLRLEDNGPLLPLRMDSDGSLLSWSDLVCNQWGEHAGYAMLRITARIITLPRVGDLAITFDAHLSRINDQWRGSKTAWIDRDKPDLPVLRVPVRNVRPVDDGAPWTTEIADHAAAIARACGMEGLDLEQDLPARPGAVRPLVPGPRIHPVGKGPGARLMLRLAEHIEATCPELQPMRFTRDKQAKITTPRRQVLGHAGNKTEETTLAVTADIVRKSVQAAGDDRVRLLCLYSTSEARTRMATQLRALSATAAPAVDGQTVEVNSGLAVSFHRLEDLLRHGNHDRSALLGDIEAIAKQETGTLLAWAETEYDPQTGKPKDDAKNPIRRLLARLGIAAQFLATQPPEPHPGETEPAGAQDKRRGRKRRAATDETKTDHAAINAAADLVLRTAGILHPSMTQDILQDFLTDTGHASVHLVGLHSRLQQSGIEGVLPRLVITAASIHAHGDPAIPWTATLWSDAANDWVTQARGIADFHAGPIGSNQRGRRGAKGVETRLYVESILDALPPGPIVTFVDAVSTRSIWPGLQNHHFGDGVLPAVNLMTQRDVAIVRCNTSREVPRPVHRLGGVQPRKDRRQPAAPDRYVYHLADTNVWLFPKSSRAYRAKGGRLGATCTPWTIPDELRHLLKDDWHAYTGTEIAVPQTGPWAERSLVTLTARLCDHTITWDDRTLAPIPLHLATRADLTHPDYRTDDEEDG